MQGGQNARVTYMTGNYCYPIYTITNNEMHCSIPELRFPQ